MVSITPNRSGIQRLMTRAQALQLTDAEKAGSLMYEMDAACNRLFRQAFVTQGASTGSAWAPLSPRYAAWKKKVRPGRKILVFDGDMRDAFVMPTNEAHIRQFIPPFTYRFGAASEKAWKHEHGAGNPGQKLPVRSVVAAAYTAVAKRIFQETLRGFYIKRLRQVFR